MTFSSIPIFSSMRKKIEKIFWDMEIIGNRRKMYCVDELFFKLEKLRTGWHSPQFASKKFLKYWKNVRLVLSETGSFFNLLDWVNNSTTQNSWNKWTKISDLETTIFELNMMVKSGLVILFLNSTCPLRVTC